MNKFSEEELWEIAENLDLSQLEVLIRCFIRIHKSGLRFADTNKITTQLNNLLQASVFAEQENLKKHARHAEVVASILALHAKSESRLKTAACWVGYFRNKAFLNWDWLFTKLNNRELILDNGNGIYKDEATEDQIANYESWKKMMNDTNKESNT